MILLLLLLLLIQTRRCAQGLGLSLNSPKHPELPQLSPSSHFQLLSKLLTSAKGKQKQEAGL
jgi:hypothetical protein